MRAEGGEPVNQDTPRAREGTITVQKHLGDNQFYVIDTVEAGDFRSLPHLVRTIRDIYDPGEYALSLAAPGCKGFRSLWVGEIQKNRYRRRKGDPSILFPDGEHGETGDWQEIKENP